MSTTQEKILKYAQTQNSFKSQNLIPVLKISRQTIAFHLKALVDQGKLLKTGSTHGASYRLRKKGEGGLKTSFLKLVKKLKDLQEDTVFQEIKNRLGLKSLLNKNVLSIAYYSFSEMLNNAIDHSQSEQVNVEVGIQNGYFWFKIRDYGIGIFDNVKKGFHLEDEYQAAERVFQGKQTTLPERHSGQGIFFTSRIADQFVLSSHKLRVLIDNERDDAHFADSKHTKGTQVEFKIKQRSKTNLQTLFAKFSSEDHNYEFNKNEIRVRLRMDRELISRSQARRLLAGLDEFKNISFDFKDIHGIGQAFTDEIFRVYASMNPEKTITYQNASPAIEFMIQRTKAEKRDQR